MALILAQRDQQLKVTSLFQLGLSQGQHQLVPWLLNGRISRYLGFNAPMTLSFIIARKRAIYNLQLDQFHVLVNIYLYHINTFSFSNDELSFWVDRCWMWNSYNLCLQKVFFLSEEKWICYNICLKIPGKNIFDFSCCLNMVWLDDW